MGFGRIVAAAMALALAACNPFESGELAEQAVDAFHQRYNMGLFSEIYDESDPELKRVTPRHELVRALIGLKQELGEVSTSEQQALSFQRPAAGGPGTASVTMATEYRYGAATENFIFSLGTEVQLVGYGYQVTRNDRPVRAVPTASDIPPEVIERLTPEIIEQLPPEMQQRLREAGAGR